MRVKGWWCGALALLLGSGCGDPMVVVGDTPGHMRVIVGQLAALGERADSIATDALLTDPSAVYFDEANSLLYVVDRGSRRTVNGIQQRVARIMTVDSRGRLRLLFDASRCATGTCIHSAGQVVGGAGERLIIADPVGHRVLSFNPATSAVTVLAGTGSDALSPDGVPAATASLRRPSGVAVGDDGLVYFSEESAGRVRYIDAQGILRTLAGSEQGYGGDGGPAAAARLAYPANLALGGGVLYVADAGNHRVRAIHLGTGTIETLAGTGAAAYGGDGGPAAAAQLATPAGLALSADGLQLFVSERDGHRVRVVHLPTGTIQTLAGTGDPEANGSRGPAGSLSLRWPSGLFAAARGVLYIADTGHYVVWRATLRL